MLRALPFVALIACGRFGFDDERQAPGGDGGADSATGDGAVPAYVPYWKSGTRLRARRWQPVDGGDPYFAGWHDSLLDTDCQSNTAADGAERCIPLHHRADQYYADAACTQRLTWSHFGPCGHDSYAYYPDSLGQAHELPIGAVYNGPVYELSATCMPATTPGGALYSLGAEVPATMFIKTSYQNRLIGSFMHTFRIWPDGAEADDNTFATGTGPCAPSGGMASGTSECLPTSDAALLPVYIDAACTQRAFLWSGSGVSPANNEFIVMQPTLCGHPFDYYKTGADVTGAKYYTLSLGTCSSNTTPANARMFTGTLTSSPYPTGTIAPGPMRGRLGYLYWTGSDGVAIPLAFWDHQLGRSCWPFIASDGVFRCLPRRPLLVDGYPNATCSSATTQIAGNCYGDVPVNSPSYPTCDDRWPDVTLMPALPTGSYADELACTPYPGTAYMVGASAGVVPPSTFEQLTEVVE